MDSGPNPVIGVTGSSGYLGGALLTFLRGQGHDVVEYRRAPRFGDGAVDVRYLNLDVPPAPGTFEGVSSLVIAAWDLREADSARGWIRNVEGTRKIVETARDTGVSRIVFVSSMSAYYGTRQKYGLMKLAVERSVLESGQVVVRPGLVYGGEWGGMTLTLSRLARLPIIPVFRHANLFTSHIDDVVRAVATLTLARDVSSAVVGLAEPTPVPFATIMDAIARATGTSSRTVTVPWQPLLLALRVAETIGVPLPVRSDSLLGLVRPANHLPGFDIIQQLGLSFRPFPEDLDGTIALA